MESISGLLLPAGIAILRLLIYFGTDERLWRTLTRQSVNGVVIRSKVVHDDGSQYHEALIEFTIGDETYKIRDYTEEPVGGQVYVEFPKGHPAKAVIYPANLSAYYMLDGLLLMMFVPFMAWLMWQPTDGIIYQPTRGAHL
ncbi:hypothetical protein [Methylocystis iwaonis]|uniref:hypothetical protein n=1 Tax=Methylocystis iwaonis TaxID=2885079 RepID=UPI002491AE54|nr:hypothetical protein [Methylocystis iwaonis]